VEKVSVNSFIFLCINFTYPDIKKIEFQIDGRKFLKSLTNSLLLSLFFPPSIDSTMADKSKKLQQVQVFGRKRNAVAVVSTSSFASRLYSFSSSQSTHLLLSSSFSPYKQALCKAGKGHIRLNGSPLHIAEPVLLRIKILEPILLLGRDRFANVDIRIRVSGGGFSSQVYAIRQAIAKAMVAYAQKCEYCGRLHPLSYYLCLSVLRKRLSE